MANSKYKIGDKVRWTGAPDSVLAIGQIFNLYAGPDGTLWYQIKWEIVEPKGEGIDNTAKDHTVAVLVLDPSDDIRPLNAAEKVLYCDRQDT